MYIDMIKGKNLYFMEYCFFFCLMFGWVLNEINKCLVFVKCSCGLFMCCKVICGLNYRCKEFYFCEELIWKEIKLLKLMIFLMNYC